MKHATMKRLRLSGVLVATMIILPTSAHARQVRPDLSGRVRPSPIARIKLVAPGGPIAPGEPASLKLRLERLNGAPFSSQRPVRVEIVGGSAFLERAVHVLDAGNSELTIPIKARGAGVWPIQARSLGFFPGSATVVCVDRKASAAAIPGIGGELSHLTGAPPPPVIHEPGAGPQGDTAGPTTPEPHPVPPAHAPIEHPVTAAPTGSTEPSPVSDPGTVRLIPQSPISDESGAQAIDILAFWFVADHPGVRDEDLDLTLVMEGGDCHGCRLEPRIVRIPAGGVSSERAGRLTSTRDGAATVTAFYPGGTSAPAEVVFRTPDPSALYLEENAEYKGLASLRLRQAIVVVDEAGNPSVMDHDAVGRLTARGPAGLESVDVPFAAGAHWAFAEVPLTRFGKYVLEADVPGLRMARTEIDYGLDWSLVLVSLAGGLLGSGAKLVFSARRRGWTKGLLRALFLGALSALLVVLLASFGILSLLQGLGPSSLWEELGKVPSTSIAGALLLGLIAGLLFEGVHGYVIGWGVLGRKQSGRRS